MAERFDVVVVGSGVAGLTAGLFAIRYGLNTVVLERSIPGGQVVNAETIENYPGLTQAIAGAEIGGNIQEQAMDLGLEMRLTEATALKSERSYHRVETAEGPLVAKAVILAGGSSLRKLGISGEEDLYGRGVSYCATCDGAFFTGQKVAVIGGGDSAVDEALTLTHFASRVILIHHKSELQAQKLLQDRIKAHTSVEFLWDTEVTAVKGNGQVTGIATRNTKSEENGLIELGGVFIFVGLEPNSSWLKDVLPLDNAGHIPVDLWMQTQIPGVFAAGDIRQHSARQLVTAAGDGATAAIAAFRHISERS